MALGTELDRGLGYIVLDGDPAPPRKGHEQPPSFRPMSIASTVAHLSYCGALVAQLKLESRYAFQRVAPFLP